MSLKPSGHVDRNELTQLGQIYLNLCNPTRMPFMSSKGPFTYDKSKTYSCAYYASVQEKGKGKEKESQEKNVNK